MSENYKAFPGKCLGPEGSGPQAEVFNVGMDLRDWFAGQALAGGIMAHLHDPACGTSWEDFKELVAESSYAFADAMLKAREQEKDA